MDKRQIFRILEINETNNEEELKNAYRAKLVKTNPEDDPEGFLQLRQAYEEALRLAKEADEQGEKDETDIFIDKAKKLYYSISKRVDEDAWRELLSDEICDALDTEEIIKEKLLIMAMECNSIPHKIWLLLDEKFGIVQDYDKLSELFPREFLDYIMNLIKYEDLMEYELFYGNDEGQIDEFIFIFFRIKKLFDECMDELVQDEYELRGDEMMEEIKELINEAKKLDVSHPYLDAIEMRVKIKEGNLDEAKAVMQELMTGFGGIDNKDYMENDFIKYNVSKGLFEMGDEEESYCLRQQILEKLPFHRPSLLDNIHYFYDRKEYSKVKDLCIEFLDKFGNFSKVLTYMRKANEYIMEDYRIKASGGDIESVYELGWCYFQNEMYDTCLEYIDNYKPPVNDEYEIEYMNLTGRCLAAKGDFDEAYKRLLRWKDILCELVDDGSQKYQRRIRRKGYAHYVIGMCLFNIWDRDRKNGMDYEESDRRIEEVSQWIKKALEFETDDKEKMYYYDRLAMVNLEGGVYDQTIDICTELIKDVPQYYFAYIYRQEAYYKIGFYNEVIDDFYEGIKYCDNEPVLYERAIKALCSYKQFDEAKDILSMATESKVRSEELEYLNIRLAWLAPQTDDEAEQRVNTQGYIRELLQMEKKYINGKCENNLEDKSEVLLLIALMSLEVGEVEQGLKYLNKTVRLNKNKAEYVYWTFANVYRADRDDENELKYLKKIKKIVKNDIELDFRMGTCYWRTYRFDKARRCFKNVYMENPEYMNVNEFLAACYVKQYNRTLNYKYISRAVFHAKKQYEIEKNSYYHAYIGKIYFSAGKISQAYKVFNDIIESDEKCPDAYVFLAKIKMLSWDYQSAYRLYEKAFEMNEETVLLTDFAMWDGMIEVCMALRKYDEAVSYSEQYSKRFNDWEYGYDKKIEIYKRMKDFEKCLEVFDKKTNDSRYEEGTLDYVHLAEIHFELNNREKGEEYVNKAISICDAIDKGEMFEDIAEIYDEVLNDYENASEYQLKAMNYSVSPQKVRRILKVATLYAICGNKSDAIRYYEKFCENVDYYYHNFYKYINEPLTARARLFNLGQFYYYMKDTEKLRECVSMMEQASPCDFCKYCNCYELLMLKGFLKELEGDMEGCIYYLTEANEVNDHGSFTDNILSLKKK